jgi:hypothetical protein
MLMGAHNLPAEEQQLPTWFLPRIVHNYGSY